MEHPSQGEGISATVTRHPSNGTVSVKGTILGLGPTPQMIHWMAAAPTTRGIGFAGSGQPYPNKEIAYSNTPHVGAIPSADGVFSLTLRDIPAGYYTGLGSVYVPPVIEFKTMNSAGQSFHTYLWITDTAAPYRWGSGRPATMLPAPLTDRTSDRSMYYFGREQLPLFENQEAQLRAKGYHGDMVQRGWPEATDAEPWDHVSAPA